MIITPFSCLLTLLSIASDGFLVKTVKLEHLKKKVFLHNNCSTGQKCSAVKTLPSSSILEWWNCRSKNKYKNLYKTLTLRSSRFKKTSVVQYIHDKHISSSQKNAFLSSPCLVIVVVVVVTAVFSFQSHLHWAPLVV